MDWLYAPLSDAQIAAWETAIDNWFFVFAIGFLIFELVRYAVLKKLKWSLMGDAIINYVTLGFFIVLNFVLLAGLYVTAYFGAALFSYFPIPVNIATVLVCIVLADLAYYWEHRLTHRVNVAWATHSVHHSSPFFNISVAYRFGPMDGLWPLFFHLPLVLLGFNPFVVLFAEMFVLTYQTALHTEAIRKLPAPIEWIFNTPSHHRVHHASNPEYLDANYGGMFIIWDRLFGTFAKEEAAPVYGLVKPIPELKSPLHFLAGPFVAFFHGFWRLGGKIAAAKGPGGVFMSLFGPPEWTPKQDG